MQGITLIVLPCLFWGCPKPAVCLNLRVQDLDRDAFSGDAQKELQLDWGAEDRFKFTCNCLFLLVQNLRNDTI